MAFCWPVSPFWWPLTPFWLWPQARTALVASGIWGLHLGMMSGLLSAEVAATVPDEIRATAFGVFNFGTGIALMLASGIAGVVWEVFSPEATFWLGGGLSLVALAWGLGLRRKV